MVAIRQISQAELPEIAKLRYQIYVAEMNRVQKYADHDTKLIVDPLDETAKIFSAEVNGSFVGTVRLNFCRDGGMGNYPDFYAIDQSAEHWSRSSITTRLMVRPKYRGTRLPLRLAQATYGFGLRNNISWNYIDCNAPMLSFFEKLGYVEQFIKTHPEYGEVHCMRLELRDEAHLEGVGSPFLMSLRTHLAECEPNSDAALV